eukprot:CAMPEP_0179212780 /NCGR_PEP_ID=MMETSP0797-20121207/1296_1 /TAXON_ID=47934 /ORGANISM="Dinophysis acuminata, Strain DAEP01" /LENGTH=159 /DNA_ID=CAMNT_0020918431 /DNA_START=28 /DNA_END=504 /DNA_ORIENTATION=-
MRHPRPGARWQQAAPRQGAAHAPQRRDMCPPLSQHVLHCASQRVSSGFIGICATIPDQILQCCKSRTLLRIHLSRLCCTLNLTSYTLPVCDDHTCVESFAARALSVHLVAGDFGHPAPLQYLIEQCLRIEADPSTRAVYCGELWVASDEHASAHIEACG